MEIIHKSKEPQHRRGFFFFTMRLFTKVSFANREIGLIFFESQILTGI
jgi:hypothetical protein